MKSGKWNGRMLAGLAAIAMLCLVSAGIAADNPKVKTVEGKPLVDTVKSLKLKPVKTGTLRVPMLTWPGDVSTVYAEQSGAFKGEGLTVELFTENDFQKQVQGVLDGETPILRGTMGMINSASETFNKAGTDLVVVYQLTWSAGGDCMVVRPGINSISDLKDKTVALQWPGPHPDLLTTILSRAGLKPTDVKIRWFKELTVPTYDTKGDILDPRSAFAADPTIDACMVISPDAADLTSREGVKGAKILFSSKQANRVIADVYAVRKDYFDANRAQVQKFVHALMVGQENFDALLADKVGQKAAYDKLITKAADLIFAAPNKVAEDSLGDCEWVKFAGNVQFFTGSGTLRNFTVLTDEIQGAFVDLKVLKAKATLKTANWDYTVLAAGLKNVDLTAVPKPTFDVNKTQQVLEKAATELSSWENDTLYQFEIYFDPNQSEEKAVLLAKYGADFKKVLEISQTFGGAQLVIEGHNAPDLVTKLKKDLKDKVKEMKANSESDADIAAFTGQAETQIAITERNAKTRSSTRGSSVKDAYLDYCKTAKITVDPAQFAVMGAGVSNPKYPTPKTKQQWNENRRVVIRVMKVNTESETFTPEK